MVQPLLTLGTSQRVLLPADVEIVQVAAAQQLLFVPQVVPVSHVLQLMFPEPQLFGIDVHEFEGQLLYVQQAPATPLAGAELSPPFVVHVCPVPQLQSIVPPQPSARCEPHWPA